jgi:hypothetical protein
MSDHTIVVTFDHEGGIVPLAAHGESVELRRQVKRGDRIRWVSPHGAATVVFADDANANSPLEDGTMGDGTFRLVVRSGNFDYRCSLQVGAQRFGWAVGGPGGGSVIVEPT